MENAIQVLTKLVTQVSLKESPAEQMRFIVDTVVELLKVDVCTLYRVLDDNSLVMVATCGLKMLDNFTIPAGKGIVGEVVRLKHAINLEDSETHPEFYYLPQTKELGYHGYLGVPLVYLGKVIGVLVVQTRKRQKFSEDTEAFLITLASQLALILGQLPVTATKVASRNVRVQGVKASAGIGIGRLRFCTSEEQELQNVVDEGCDDPEETIKQWHALLEEVNREIRAKQEKFSESMSSDVSSIFDAYSFFLSDPTFTALVEAKIRAGSSLPAALKSAVRFFSSVFKEMDDDYLKARHEDIEQLGEKLYSHWKLGSKPLVDEPEEESVILVGRQVSVFDIASIPVDKLAGVVSYEGTSLSHSAVLCNALGVPAVMGTGALSNVQNGDEIIVDGNTGKVILFPSPALRAEYTRLFDKAQRVKKQLQLLRGKPAITPDGVVVELFANTGLQADLSPGLENGAAGIGLYRTEVLFMARESFPSEADQIESYKSVLAAYEGKPVYMRTLDVGGDKPLPYFPITGEDNPALGWRGIRFALDNLQVLVTQIRAMLIAAGKRENFNIIIPMISSTSELDGFIQVLDDVCHQLEEERVEFRRPKLGIMVEVPAAISQIPLWKNRIDFVSIGSNDLSQYLLALDRNNRKVAGRYDNVHPAILMEIRRIIEICKALGLPASLCGEMANDPVAVVLLIGFGLRRLSLSSSHIPEIKALIRTVPLEEAETLASQSIEFDCGDKVRENVRQALSRYDLEDILGQ